MLSYPEIIERARERLPAFEEAVAGVPYEPKGVLNSEVLFFAACATSLGFRRILESGRARAQSTLLLSLCFPGTPIISVERDPDSDDATVAATRLAGRPDVRLEFGDATEMLPRIAEPGDVAIIDGPKGFSGIGLAIELLAGGRVSQAFVHDLTTDTVTRAFVAKHFPEARFSDHRGWASMAGALDRACLPLVPPERRLDGFTGEFGYGFALTWLPRVEGRNYRRLARLLRIRKLFHRLFGREGRRRRAALSPSAPVSYTHVTVDGIDPS